ncbi:hypothetical protein [Deinococcus planocerae]|uniref:hypothetical protein n=1 Tax=Deinococcus planocerae TaxID=1737569 RepID=UPI0011AED2D3|nr:hypothetical protein [Deinococcus planocerae]
MNYVATSAEVTAAIAEIGPALNVGGSTNYFSVAERTPTQVVLKSPALPGLGSNIQVTFTALQSGNTTMVMHTYKGSLMEVRADSPTDQSVKEVYTKLSQKFQMAP